MAPYAGKGIDELATRGAALSAPLPPRDQATHGSDPVATVREILQRFEDVTGGERGRLHPHPYLTIRDVRGIANFVTLALRNDLANLNRPDAAVLWETWRRVIDRLQTLMGGVRDDFQALSAVNVLVAAWDVVARDLTLARVEPGVVTQRFCPWRDEWLTDRILYPEVDS